MNKLRNFFTNQKMTWPRVIIFAVATAALTAALNIIPVFENTSFQNIAVYIECWILFALFIIVNCKKWQEAALKTFVFFLISQPLVYLIEVPFKEAGWDLFNYYGRWFVVTVLTLPGAVVAYQVKRKDWLSVAVLSVANAYLAFASADYFWTCTQVFPRQLFSAVFCLALAILFLFLLLDDKKHRAVGAAVIAVVFAVSLFVNKPDSGYEVYLPADAWTYEITDESVASVETDKNGNYVIRSEGLGYGSVKFTDESGQVIEYGVTVTTGGMFCSEITP